MPPFSYCLMLTSWQAVTNKDGYSLKNHRIVEYFELEGTLKGYLGQFLCNE